VEPERPALRLPSRTRTLAAAVLVAAAVVWPLVNSGMEGAVLVAFTPDHGLTLADLLSPAAVALAVLLLLTGRRH
jgi:hypothetical protein